MCFLEDGMKQQLVSITFILFLVVSLLFPLFFQEDIQAYTLPKFYVDDDYDETTPDWGITRFNEIQYAIENATAGDRIFVLSGTYNENLIIDKKLDVFGENRSSTIIDGGDVGNVVNITAPFVNLSHFTIRDSGSDSNDSIVYIAANSAIITDTKLTSGNIGIFIRGVDDCIIYDNIITTNSGNGIQCNQSDDNEITYNQITSNYNGIMQYSCDRTLIDHNSILSNSLHGILSNESCDLNTITSNTIQSNTKYGIFLLDQCNQNSILSNIIKSNTLTGIKIENSSTNNISNCRMQSNSEYGVLITGSENILWTNIIRSNSKHGVFLLGDDNSTIYGNIIARNTFEGVTLYNTSDAILRNNYIHHNGRYGIYLDYFTISNSIYNNRIYQNTNSNAMDKSTNNRNNWNISKSSGTNTIQGSYFGGNYWDDYTGPDYNDDGLGNTTYHIYADNYDYLPLVDVIPPTISAMQVDPSQATTEDEVTISAVVSDDINVTDVRIILTDPSGVTSNYSIFANKSGNTYSSSTNFLEVGTYEFYIKATDTRHWTSVINSSFVIQQGVPPTVTDNTETATYPGASFEFNATVSDDTTLETDLTVMVNWNHGSKGGNYSMILMDDYFILEVTLDSTIDPVEYTIYACDEWRNSFTTEETEIEVIDTQKPHIQVESYGPSPSGIPNSFTYGVNVTDDVSISEVFIEYWLYNGSHLSAPMDYLGNHLYEKTLVFEQEPDQVFCIITATDTSGNQNDTTSPYPIISYSPFLGGVNVPLSFNASESFDLDGDIVQYAWTFGDGVLGNGESIQHTYSTNGNYSLTLTVADNDGNSASTTTYVNVSTFSMRYPTTSILNYLEQQYNVSFTESFFSYDSNGDEIVDTFLDPTNTLTVVHRQNIMIQNHSCFLLSIDDPDIPEFFWNVTNNSVNPIIHAVGEINYSITHEDTNSATVSVLTNKTTGWIYLQIDDLFPLGSVSVQCGNRTIDQDKIIRKNGYIFILDDPELEYLFTFHNITEPVVLEDPEFYPVDGGIIDENNPTITITYNIPVTIIDAGFGPIALYPSDFHTNDNMEFSYTPPHDLEEQTHEFYLIVEDESGTLLDSSAIYFYFPYEVPEEEGTESNPLLFLLGGIFLVLCIAFVMKIKRIRFDDYIYYKQWKIFPFFKPIVLGPMSVNIDVDGIAKAEFYVDGKLQDTLKTKPYRWEWNQNSVWKHSIEAKIYDSEGQNVSSGSIDVIVLNPLNNPRELFTKAEKS